MADSDRLDSRSPHDAASRADGRGADLAAQIETLLLEGLDRYFSHHYDDAIHVWTRVLFLDRDNARARAYIDRAHTAVAEQQRRGEELLQASQDLLDQGDTASARTTLQQAVASGADDARAAALWLKIERRERARPTASIGPDVLAASAAGTGERTSRSTPRFATVAVVAMGVIVAGVLVNIVSRAWLPVNGTSDATPDTSDRIAPVIPSNAEVALIRARALYARGRLAEALHALDRVPSTAQNRVEADALRREIQRLLLATAQPRPAEPQGPHS